MMHLKRSWCVLEVETAAELARLLTEMSWGCCKAFYVRGFPDYVWVNDSTSPGSLQEYGVVKRNLPDGAMRQLESITVSWCSLEEMLAFIERTLAGKDDNAVFSCDVEAILQTSKEHDRCQHCA